MPWRRQDGNASMMPWLHQRDFLLIYYAKNDYIWHRELPTGKGFADIVLICHVV